MDFDFKVVDEVVKIRPIQDERKERMWLKPKRKKSIKKDKENKVQEQSQKSSEKKSIIDIYV